MTPRNDLAVTFADTEQSATNAAEKTDRPEPDPRPRTMTAKVLTCREAGHHFPWGRDRTKRERLRELVDGEWTDLVQVTRTCSCCKSERVDVYYEHSLKLLRRTYRLVEGYTSEPGNGRVERGDVRRELLRRYL